MPVTPQFLGEWEEALGACTDGAEGDSNDDEIEALRDAVELAATLFGGEL